MNVFIAFLGSVKSKYKSLFSIEEIERELILQWMFGASLFYFFVSFSTWIENKYTTLEAVRSGTAICWPYFQNCHWLYFLEGFPYGYSQSTLYMLFYGVMCFIAYLMWRKLWVFAHMLLALLLLWKIFVVFLLSFVVAGPYDYYHIILTAALLFVPYKEYFLKVSFVFMYFVSVTTKFTPAWELGTYFSSLRSGAPLFPAWSSIFLTNFVIFIQIVESWFLLSRYWILQRIALVIAVAFHLYSGILVFYNYPSAALLPLLILFGPFYRYTKTPFGGKTIAGWVLILLVGLFQLLGFVVSPDRFSTLEGHRFGMFMFEANHQCSVQLSTYSTDIAATNSWSGLQCTGPYLYCTTDIATRRENGETVRTKTLESASSWNRCNPYEIWFVARSACGFQGVKRVSMQYDHSINGGPFYRMVDESDICGLAYKAFSHNEWIRLPGEAPVVGYPVQNFYSL